MVGQAQAEKLEKDSRSRRNCNRVYSVLTGTASCSSGQAVSSPLAVDPADIAITQPNGHNVATRAFSGELIYVYRTKVARVQVNTL